MKVVNVKRSFWIVKEGKRVDERILKLFQVTCLIVSRPNSFYFSSLYEEILVSPTPAPILLRKHLRTRLRFYHSITGEK